MTEGYDSPSSKSRALVVISRESENTPANDNRAHRHHRARRSAGFLTQLIANASQVPQTCEKRRAEPNEVIAAYRETMAKIQKLNAQAS
jgi:hypothetical protein